MRSRFNLYWTVLGFLCFYLMMGCTRAHNHVDEEDMGDYTLEGGHSCGHGHPSIHQKISHSSAMPLAGPLRGMAAQADTFRSIRIRLNTTFIEHPELDKSLLTGANKSCTAVGETLIISSETGDSRPISTPCVVNGEVQYVGNCYVVCTEADIVTPTIAQRFRNNMENIKLDFEGWLRVQEFPNYPSIFTDGECGDLRLSNESVSEDVVVFLTLRTMPYLPTTLAFANPCTLHRQSSRPITIHVNVQPSTLAENGDITTVLRHEVLHGLGFSSDMFKFFRHPSDRTKTYYDYSTTLFPTGPVRTNAPSAVVMNDFNGVFGPQIVPTNLGPGNWLKLVTPNVVAFGRQYFNCSTLDGVELENDGTNASAATHWESRILYWELMTAVQKSLPGKLTGFTAALMKDTGFYEVASSFVPDQMDFGYEQGCSFTDDTCNTVRTVNGGKEKKSWYFCDTQYSDFCGYNNQFIGLCNTIMFSNSLPAPYQYFSEDPTMGGSDEFLNRCPMTVAYADGFCSSRLSTVGVTNVSNYFFESNGSSTRCHRSSVLDSRYVFEGGVSVVRCFKTICSGPRETMVRLADYMFPCRADSAVEFVGPVTDATAIPQLNFYIRTSVAKGIFTCSDPSTMCDSGLSTLNADMASGTGWPVILPENDEGYPLNLTLDGNEMFVIRGKNLESCIGARIGGADVAPLISVNSTVILLQGPRFTKQTGGGADDGSGTVQLQLKCKVRGCESDGCYVTYEPLLLYPAPAEEGSSAADEDDDFFSGIGGIVVFAAIGLVLLIILCVGFRCMFGGNDESKFDDGEETVYSISPSANRKRAQPLMQEQELHVLQDGVTL